MNIIYKYTNILFQIIELETKKREQAHAWLKNVANDMLPFLILSPQIEDLKNQLIFEEKNDLNTMFCEKLTDPYIINMLNDLLNQNDILIDYNFLKDNIIKKMVYNINTDKQNKILNMSTSEKYSLFYDIKKIKEFNQKNIKKNVNLIETSVKKTNKIRKKIQSSSINGLQEHMDTKEFLLSNQQELKENILNINYMICLSEENLEDAHKLVSKTKKLYELELKNASIKDLSLKSINFLEELQEVLHSKQIYKLENLFLKELNFLMHKSNFISDVKIDKNFNIFLYTSKVFTELEILELKKSSDNVILDLLGKPALEQLKSNSIINNTLTIKVDAQMMSKGEKQIYIMALYKSLISLSKFEVPFVIDTPFARIDNSHRKNILEYFFKQLKGQVFILSTDQEITQEHIVSLKEHINKVFTIENKHNKTLLLENTYFGKDYKNDF